MSHNDNDPFAPQNIAKAFQNLPKLPFEVQICPWGNQQMLYQLIARGFEPMSIFLGPIMFEQEVEVEVTDEKTGETRREKQTQKGQKMDYVVWLKKKNSALETPNGALT